MTEYCCIDCKYYKVPFDVDEFEVPRPTNPYCKKGNDKNFPKRQSPYLSWICHPEYEKHICEEFKLSLWVKFHLRKPYKVYQEERKLIWEKWEKELEND